MMSMGRTHKIFALLLLLLAIKLGVNFSTEVGIVFIGAFLAGSTFLNPDIDIKLSWIPGIKHRGVTHSIITALVVGAIIAMIPLFFGYPIGIMTIAVGAGIAIAWIAHHFEDSASNMIGGVRNDWLMYIIVLIAIAFVTNSMFNVIKI